MKKIFITLLTMLTIIPLTSCNNNDNAELNYPRFKSVSDFEEYIENPPENRLYYIDKDKYLSIASLFPELGIVPELFVVSNNNCYHCSYDISNYVNSTDIVKSFSIYIDCRENILNKNLQEVFLDNGKAEYAIYDNLQQGYEAEPDNSQRNVNTIVIVELGKRQIAYRIHDQNIQMVFYKCGKYLITIDGLYRIEKEYLDSRELLPVTVLLSPERAAEALDRIDNYIENANNFNGQ